MTRRDCSGLRLKSRLLCALLLNISQHLCLLPVEAVCSFWEAVYGRGHVLSGAVIMSSQLCTDRYVKPVAFSLSLSLFFFQSQGIEIANNVV